MMEMTPGPRSRPRPRLMRRLFPGNHIHHHQSTLISCSSPQRLAAAARAKSGLADGDLLVTRRNVKVKRASLGIAQSQKYRRSYRHCHQGSLLILILLHRHHHHHPLWTNLHPWFQPRLTGHHRPHLIRRRRFCRRKHSLCRITRRLLPRASLSSSTFARSTTFSSIASSGQLTSPCLALC